MHHPITSDVVQAAFDRFPNQTQEQLLHLRQLIFDTALNTEGVGEIEETLKWGEPSYVTKPKTGSTIRLGAKQSQPNQFAMYFNCKTTLVLSFREIHGDVFQYGTNRAILFELGQRIPKQALSNCIAMALTYHLKS